MSKNLPTRQTGLSRRTAGQVSSGVLVLALGCAVTAVAVTGCDATPPSHAAAATAAPAETAPGKDAPGKDAPGKDAPGKDAPVKDVPVSDAERAAARANNRFALRLLTQIAPGKAGSAERPDGENVFVGTAGLYSALSATAAGAEGSTATQFAKLLDLPSDRASANQQAAALAGIARGDGKQLTAGSAMWLARGSAGKMRPEFQTAAGLRLGGAAVGELDFASDAAGALTTINDWAAKATAGHIRELLSADSLGGNTKLVLASAANLSARWAVPFAADQTSAGDFRASADSSTLVAMMNRVGDMPYATDDTWQALELPFDGGRLGMLILLPTEDKPGALAAAEAKLDADRLEQLSAALKTKRIKLSLPRFRLDSRPAVTEALKSLGLTDAFGETADLSGINGGRDLYLGSVTSRALLTVSEEGAEASGASAVVIKSRAMPHPFAVDRPALVLLRDRRTGAIVFAGRLTDPER